MREKKERPRILFFITEDWYFCSHRLPIARAARDAGFEVVVATRVQKHKEQIIQEGFKLIPIRLRRSNKNPLKELLSLIELITIYRLERPDLVHHVAIKPVLYGSLAARIAHVPAVVNALAGMGYLFISNNWKTKLFLPVIMHAFRWLFNRHNSRVILQNPDDEKMFINAKVLQSAQITLIRGSGVNINEFFSVPESGAMPMVVLASRMLWDKGIGEFVAAAQLLKEQNVQARFVLVGDSDPDNPASIPTEQL
ncbi:MAG: glycosyl transferase family 1, partial [Planctomycetes bacterium RBG_16_41_13]